MVGNHRIGQEPASHLDQGPNRRYNKLVYPLQVARWMMRRTLWSPKGLAWAALCLFALPLLTLFSPAGLIEDELPMAQRISQMGALAQVFGCVLAMIAFEECRWILDLASPSRRLLARLTGLTATAALGLTLVLISGLGVFGETAWPSLEWFWVSLSGIVHLALLAGLLLELPGRPAMRPALLPFLTLVLPALVPSRHIGLAWIPELFGLRGADPMGGDPHQAELWAHFGPIMVLGALVGLLLAKRSQASTGF